MPDKPQNKSKPQERFKLIKKYFRQYKGYLIVGGIAIIFADILILLIPYYTKVVFDLLEHGGEQSKILNFVLLMIGLAVMSGIFRFMTRRTLIWMSRHMEYNLRGALVGHLLKLSPSFYDNNRTGDIMARATNDLDAVRMMLGPGLMYITNTIVSLIIAGGFMIYLSSRLTLFALMPMLVFPFLVNKLGNLIHLKFIKIQEQFSLLTAIAQENLAGMRVVKAYRQEEPEIENFSNESQKYVEQNLGMAKLQATFYPLIYLLVASLNLVVLYFGGLEVWNGTIELGTMVAFFGYLQSLIWPMFAMGWVVSLYQRGTASLDRINRILHTDPKVKNETSEPYTGKLKGKIEFKNLNFAYDGKPALYDINLLIKPGTTLGVVGMTGSGKSTLAMLLGRLYPIRPEQLFVDDIDILEWDLAALRSQIGFAPQEPFMFSDTIAENIKFGNEQASVDDIIGMSKAAALAKDVEDFPRRYDTIVGERGITLSGGQKQRAAIARALMVRPSILILDDVTASVDTETENQIYDRLDDNFTDCTRIIISHRVSSVKDADQIIYIEDGRIVEKGTHRELLAGDQRYAELYKAQLLETELEGL